MSSRKHMLFALTLALVLALSTIGALGAGAAPAGAPVVSLSVDQTSFNAKQGVVVHVTIANPTDRPVKVLKWFTPAEDVEEPIFAVTRDGAAVSYVGAIYKRPVPTAADFVVLKAGESLSRDVNLGAYYDLSVSGNYTIRYDVASTYLYSERRGRLAERLASKDLGVWIDGRAAPTAASPVADAVTGSTSFTKCTTSQQSLLLTARTEASNYAAGALSYLNGGKTGSRYTTWFGTYLASRYSTVTSHFSSIGNAMDTKPVTFNCGCKKQYYAYVYPTQPYTIYLCRVYWQAPMTGTDSKAGTLIHEMSHFNVVASTDDYVYGQSGARNLALTDPAKAIDNADNHEYFAENNPALP